MKKRLFRLFPLLLLCLLLSGCANPFEDLSVPEWVGGLFSRFTDVQGHWVDVNSDTVLDISGRRLTVSRGDWKEHYRFKKETRADGTYLVSTKDDGGFGVMSELEICSDGSLRAYERVLDAAGHSYRFVREEELEKELEIRDLSKDRPKEILSDEIESFSLSFHNSCGSYGLSSELWEPGGYSWEITREEDGYRMDFRIMGDSYVALDFSGIVSEDYVKGLARRIVELGIPEHNGYYMTNNVSRPGWSLFVSYASGEKLSLMAGGSAAEECVFDLAGLLDYAREQDLYG